MEENKTTKSPAANNEDSGQASLDEGLNREVFIGPLEEPKSNPESGKSESLPIIQEDPISKDDSSINPQSQDNLAPRSNAIFRNLSGLLLRFRKIGLLALIGLGLSLYAMYLDYFYSEQSSTGQDRILEKQDLIKKDIEKVPDTTATRVAELVGLKEIIREGPMRDLATLARDSDAAKRAANAKVNSGNRILELEGAQEIESIALKRASALKKINGQAAEDYRQAGAAYLVGHHLRKAVSAYEQASRLDPGHFSGHLTLSELALRLENFELAEDSVITALAVIESRDKEDWWYRRFGLNQLAKVYLAKNDLKKAVNVVKELEVLTREKLEEATAERKNFGSLEEYGLTRVTTSGGKYGITVYYDGEVLTSYQAKPDQEGKKASDKRFNGVLATDVGELTSREQHMETLVLKGQVLADLNDTTGAMTAYKEGLILARKQINEIGISGKELAIADFLERLGYLLEKQGDFTKALSLYKECLGIHRNLARLSGDGEYEKFVAEFGRDYIPDYQRNIARILRKVSQSKKALGENTGAFDAMQERVEILRMVISKDKQDKDQFHLALALVERGAYYFNNQELERSCQDLREAKTLVGQLIVSDEYGRTAKDFHKKISNLRQEKNCN